MIPCVFYIIRVEMRQNDMCRESIQCV